MSSVLATEGAFGGGDTGARRTRCTTPMIVVDGVSDDTNCLVIPIKVPNLGKDCSFVNVTENRHVRYLVITVD